MYTTQKDMAKLLLVLPASVSHRGVTSQRPQVVQKKANTDHQKERQKAGPARLTMGRFERKNVTENIFKKYGLIEHDLPKKNDTWVYLKMVGFLSSSHGFWR